MTSPTTSSSTTARSKVRRVIETYDLGGLGDDLERRWTADGDDQYSLRELAALFNLAVLRAALEAAGVYLSERELEAKYELLTDDDASESTRMQAVRSLEKDGVDIDDVTGDFVSHQAIYRYLKNHRGASHETTASDPVETASQAIQRLRSRTNAVANSNLERLDDAGHVSVSDFEILVDITVLCTSCGQSAEFSTLLERGGCRCTRDER
ncbi:rod-determining factor RdfA [Haloarchaeobius amylolyticus]|uniref:rod-determining factor RdfA n=1 Tax=Haloarchaeobius amylolyticus TaxID=1198296 RepID=UPI002271E2EC|nr:rod-determining factor RdfA [Haloarchaeobius amylolyticus]